MKVHQKKALIERSLAHWFVDQHYSALAIMAANMIAKL